MSFRNNRLTVLGLVTIILPLIGCSSSACKVGESRACVGPGACSGKQACNSDGANWTTCDCGDTTGGASTGGQSSTSDPYTTGGLSNSGGVTASGGEASNTCDSQIPTAGTSDGGLSVVDNYVEIGSLHGYASVWSCVGPHSTSTVCTRPACTTPDSFDMSIVVAEGCAPKSVQPVSCSPGFGASALCGAGMLPADSTYESAAAVGFNFNQDPAVDAGSLGGINIANSITITVQTFDDADGNLSLRPQMLDANGDFYCIEAGSWTSGAPISINRFSTECWGNTGKRASSSTVFRRLDMLVPSHSSLDRPFSFCLTNVSVD